MALGSGTAVAATTAANTASIEPPIGVTDSSGGCVGAAPPTCSGNNTSTSDITVWAATVAKSASPASGSAVLPGTVITYTVAVTVTGAATTSNVALTDTLGAGLTFGAVSSNTGGFVVTPGSPLGFTLPSGAAIGTHTLQYTATVAANASATLTNSVVGANCTPAAPCTTTHPLGTLTLAKSLFSESGTQAGIAEAGETMVYRLTVTNTSGTAVSYDLTDVLGSGLTYVSSSHTGVHAGQTTTWTALSVPANGSLVVSVTATVDAPVGVASVTNLAKPAGAPNPPCPSATCVVTPTAATVSLVKTLSAETGTQPGIAEAGETLTYQLTLTNAGGTAASYDLTDVLNGGLSFVSATHGGVNAGQTTTWTALSVPANGSLVVSIAARVNVPIVAPTLGNLAKQTGSPDPACPSAGCMVIPTAGNIGIAKTLVAESGTRAGIAEAGETLTYRITLNNVGGVAVPYNLTDTLSAGLTFVSATNGGINAGQTTTWTALNVPANGSLVVTVVARVDATITTTSVSNIAKLTGTSDTACPSPTCVVTPTAGGVRLAKALSSESGVLAGIAEAGETLTYRITLTNTGGTAAPYDLTDTLSAGQTYVSSTNGGVNAGQTTTWTALNVPANGSLVVTLVATVNTPITTTTVGNLAKATGSPDPACPSATCESMPTAGSVGLVKTLLAESGTRPGIAEAGETLTYRITLSNTSGTPASYDLTDTLSAGMTYVSSTNGGINAGQTTTWTGLTVPAGGSLNVTLVATVNTPIVSTSITNLAKPTGSPDPGCPSAACVTTPTAGSVGLVKALVAESGVQAGVAEAGETLTYQVTLTNTGGSAARYDLTDTLGAGLTYASSTDGGINAGQTTTWSGLSVPANGSLVVTLVATVDSPVRTALVTNLAKPTGGPDPACPSSGCVQTPTAASVSLVQILASENGSTPGIAEPGETLVYQITLTNPGGTPAPFDLTETLTPGQAYVSSSPGGVNSGQTTNWSGLTVPANGSLVFTVTATVDPQIAVAHVDSLAKAQGAADPACPSTGCVTTPTAAQVRAVKRLVAEDGSQPGVAEAGETLTYSITLSNTGGRAFTGYRFVENVPAGATFTSVSGASGIGSPVAGPAAVPLQVPSVPVGGATVVTVVFRVADASPGDLTELVNRIGGGDVNPDCGSDCIVSVPVAIPAQLSLLKAAAVREARVGDLVRYTLTVTNVGRSNLVNGRVIDTPPAGFGYVTGSMHVADGDGAFKLGASVSPLQIDGLDIAIGQRATITYLLRVGAGARPGVYVNHAQAVDFRARPVSNLASAEVSIVADPLIDESLIIGTVFDDRNGDGWQAPASLSGLRVQGGFEPGAYIAGSTTIDRGQGAVAEPDASAPLLHGIALGRIAGRQSEADAAENHQVVIRQRVTEPRFTDDFTLSSDQGVTLRMDAAGNTRLEKSGDAAKGLNGAEPSVTRRVSSVEGGYAVDYVIRNVGIDERGIPGVRIASVEGLLVETDPFGRYHLTGISGGDWARGRNFILKVDPTTLPAGAEFTTVNPLLRRVTPGLPVRFDFGVKLPVDTLKGTERIDIELGEVLFAPGSAAVQAQYAAVIRRMAAKVEEYGGGELIISANGEAEALALGRAQAVEAALRPLLSPASAAALRVSARTELTQPASTVVGVGHGAIVLGSVLFDTDKALIRPQYRALLAQVARSLAEQKGGVVQLVGHTDSRASDAYNLALGLRRAKAVFQAIAEQLNPEDRAKVRVETSNDVTPAARAVVR